MAQSIDEMQNLNSEDQAIDTANLTRDVDNTANLCDQIMEFYNLSKKDYRTYSPLTLAYIGDSIFDLVVKTVVVETANCSANILHRKTTKYVKAEAQSKIVDDILGMLSDEEMSVYRRGRNAKSPTTAKNASIEDYRKATGLEALIGYLYLSGRMDRILYIIKSGMDMLDE